MPVTQEQRTALALGALGEITDPADVGELLSIAEVEPGVVDLRFACTLAAYAGWSWTVSISDLPHLDPTVLEVELLPGDGALLAPPWVPWTERLAEWRRQHPDEQQPDDEPVDVDEAEVEREDEDGDLDEDDLAVDDGLDELDEAELEGEESPEEQEQEQDSGDISDEDDELASQPTPEPASEPESEPESTSASRTPLEDEDPDSTVRPAEEDRTP